MARSNKHVLFPVTLWLGFGRGPMWLRLSCEVAGAVCNGNHWKPRLRLEEPLSRRYPHVTVSRGWLTAADLEWPIGLRSPQGYFPYVLYGRRKSLVYPCPTLHKEEYQKHCYLKVLTFTSQGWVRMNRDINCAVLSVRLSTKNVCSFLLPRITYPSHRWKNKNRKQNMDQLSIWRLWKKTNKNQANKNYFFLFLFIYIFYFII